MTYTIALYSPDTHVTYDGDTPDQRGIGGGVTSRVRLLRALARLGYRVSAYVNCERPGVYHGVTYQRFDTVTRLAADVLIVGTTGGQLDLSPLAAVALDVRLRYLIVAGVPPVQGLAALKPDYYCIPSNFMRDWLAAQWGVPERQLFVNRDGVEEANFRSAELAPPARDPFALVYLGHPGKGLDRALAVLRVLRDEHDARYHLDVFGTHAIWGQPEQALPEQEGVRYCGLVAQPELAQRLFGYTYCLALQKVREAGGLAVQDAKRAGVIVLASQVGVFGEVIRPGYDGFWVGDGTAGPAETAAAIRVILSLAANPDYAEFVRRQAQGSARSWDLVARTLVAHWEQHFAGPRAPATAPAPSHHPRYACPHCRVAPLALPDGWHCPACGRYYPLLEGITSFAEQDGSYSELPAAEFGQLLGSLLAAPWREAVTAPSSSANPFLKRYMLEESRGYFHFLLDLTSASRVLDLGCGYGTVSAAIARHCSVAAVDNSLLRLAFLRQRCREDQLERITLIHADGLALPFEPEQFDLVTLVGVLEWAGTAPATLNPEALQAHWLRNCYDVLKPGGCLYLGIENRYGFKYLLGAPDDHTGIADITYLDRAEADIKSQAARGQPYRVRTHTRPAYRALLQAAGFKRVEFYAPYPDYRLWTALVPLDPPEIARFYLEHVQEDRLPGSAEQPVQSLERAASHLGNLEDYVNSYAVLAWK